MSEETEMRTGESLRLNTNGEKGRDSAGEGTQERHRDQQRQRETERERETVYVCGGGRF